MLPEKKGGLVTKCWSCANAICRKGYGCTWSRSFMPVDGWEAVYDGDNETWFVIDCPEFTPEVPMDVDEYESEGLLTLFLVVVREAGKDYLSELRSWLPVFLEWQQKVAILSQFYGPKKTPSDDWYMPAPYWARWAGELEIPSEILKLELFFKSQKAEAMMDGDPRGIMGAIKKSVLEECRRKNK